MRFDDRIAALARAHDLLIESNWNGADFVTLVRNQLRPYAPEGAGRLQVDGPAVVLAPELATPAGLVLHELAVNAAKYGAWSGSKGSVNLSWRLNSANTPQILTVSWQERGGPPPRTARTRGLGSALIEQGIPGATVQREFQPEGLVCTIELPLAEGEA